ncbi:MAG: uroporphyrinogen-III synthase [Firmicutes bacterium]|nr:uroporphyrinogen-III synthase [Alicyclobacillaceae bacterium]MCL6497598.1 uroporphyrinogen-III synthase [Bacillota bacterium]
MSDCYLVLLRENPRLWEALAPVEALGYRRALAPVQKVGPPASWAALDAALARLMTYHGILFTSQEGVRGLTERARALGVDWARYPGWVAVAGPATQRAAEAAGFRVAVTATESFGQAGLVAALGNRTVVGQRLLWPTGNLSAPKLVEALSAAGAAVDRVEVYRNLPRPWPSEARGWLRDGQVAGVVYTAGSSARYLWDQLDAAEREALRQALHFSMGPETSVVLRQLGIEPAAEARPSTVAALAAAVIECLAAVGEGM